MMRQRYAKPCCRFRVWCVAVHDEYGWVYMCEWSDEENDWVTCTFENEEQATKAADEYTEFFKEAE